MNFSFWHRSQALNLYILIVNLEKYKVKRKVIRMKVFDGLAGRWRTLRKNPGVRPNRFRAFVDFVHNKFGERYPITARSVVKMGDCPIRDEETAGKYLQIMQERGFST